MSAFAKCSCLLLQMSHMNILYQNSILKQTKPKPPKDKRKCRRDFRARGGIAMPAIPPTPSPKLLCFLRVHIILLLILNPTTKLSSEDTLFGLLLVFIYVPAPWLKSMTNGYFEK